MTTSFTPIDAVDALAHHIAEAGAIKFGDLFDYLETHGIKTAGDKDLTGEHVDQPHVNHSTTLRDRISDEFVRIVAELFHTRPVMLEIGDMASFRSGEEPWWVRWTGHRDALVDAAIEFVHDRGAVTFMELADELRFNCGVPVLGGMTMMLDRHAVGDGVVMTQPSNTKNVVLWNCGSAEFLPVVELMLDRETQVVLERTSAEHYRLNGMVLLEDHDDDGGPARPLPVIDFGDELAAEGYEVPTWLPVVFAWAERD